MCLLNQNTLQGSGLTRLQVARGTQFNVLKENQVASCLSLQTHCKHRRLAPRAALATHLFGWLSCFWLIKLSVIWCKITANLSHSSDGKLQRTRRTIKKRLEASGHISYQVPLVSQEIYKKLGFITRMEIKMLHATLLKIGT